MVKKAAAKETKVTTVTVERADGNTELEITPAGELPDEEDDALAALAEMGAGSGARYEVRRTSPGEFAGYVATYGHDELSLERLQEEWGGGKFTIRVRGEKGNFLGSANIQIAGRPKHKTDAPPTLGAAPVASNNQDALIAAIMGSTKGQIEMLTTLVKSLIERPAAPPVPVSDPLDIIEKLGPLLRPAPATDAGEAIKLFMQGLTLGKELNGSGGDGEGPGMMGMFSKGLDTIKTLAAQQQQPQQQAPRVAVRRPAPAPAPQVTGPAAGSVEAEAPQEADPVAQKIQWLAQQTGYLVQLASRGKDPELYAELFLDNLPAFITNAEVFERMQSPEAISDLAMLNPNVQRFAPWFEEFRQAVVELLTDDAEPDPLQAARDIGTPEGTPIIEVPGGDDGMGG
jgi:hypothetical protein